ncbi:MAG: cysteine-rich CWC family protein [Mucilaginibacter polytrichastri]|nr:cysteine-rich CWC family protein [Mucilaginibacter polytrichastri]
MGKHEWISCERCGTRMECKANAYTKCACTAVQLTPFETQFISEQFEGCLCVSCLAELQREYQSGTPDFAG